MAKLKLACDIETTSRHLACLGIADSKTTAICIPIMDSATKGTNYFTLEEELTIVMKVRELLTHPNVSIVWQNGAYDVQHFAKHWGFMPNFDDDTMLMQHVCFPGESKSLDFLMSIYGEYYEYWKDDLKDYRKLPDDTNLFWNYNCTDCVNTYELRDTLSNLISALNLTEQYQFLMSTSRNAVNAMLRGIDIDTRTKNDMTIKLLDAIQERETLIQEWTGTSLNVKSPLQLKTFFYDELQLKPITHKKTRKPTTDSDALDALAIREPLLKQLCSVINELRSLGSFLSTFVQMPLDVDGKMRCSYNAGGTETFRLSSSENAFGSGGNLQNIPRNHDDD
jgi:DNA polymerase I-like protein with 3'-5' exonuclease and polymerase domains